MLLQSAVRSEQTAEETQETMTDGEVTSKMVSENVSAWKFFSLFSDDDGRQEEVNGDSKG